MDFNLADLNRQVINLVRIGSIEQVDHENATLRVRCSESGLLTGWIAWPAEIGRNYRRWRPLAVGQQVIVNAPHGELEQAFVVGLLFTGSVGPPSQDPEVDKWLFNDGTAIEHNNATGVLSIKGAKKIILDAEHMIFNADQMVINVASLDINEK